MGRANSPALARGGTNLYNALIAPTSNQRLTVDVTRYNRLMVVLYVVGAASANDVGMSIDVPPPAGAGGTYLGDDTPSVQPSVMPINTGAVLYNAALTVESRTLYVDVSMLQAVLIRLRNTTAGNLLTRVDAWGL